MPLLPPLETNEPITEVNIVFFAACIDVYLAALLLPMPLVEGLMLSYRGKDKRSKAPPLLPGSVISISHRDIQRGLVLNANPKSFRHTTSVDISVPYVNAIGEVDLTKEGKNVNVKISRQSFQISGVKHRKQAEIASDYLFDYLIRIESILQYMQKHKDETSKVIDWVLKNAFLTVTGNSNGKERKGLTIPPVPESLNFSIMSLIYYHLPHIENLEFLTVFLQKITEFSGLFTPVGKDDWEEVLNRKNLTEAYQVRLQGHAAYFKEAMIKRDHKITLKEPLNIGKTVAHFRKNKDFIVIFDPAVDSSMEVIIPVNKYSPEMRGAEVRSIRFYLFKFHFNKSVLKIKNVGPGGESAVRIYEKIRSHLALI